MTIGPRNRLGRNVRRVRRGPRARRGGVYVLVLGVASMVAVVGLGAIAVSRVQIKSTRAASNWSQAESLAEAGVETAIATMNTSTTWRTSLVSGSRVSIGALGGGKAGYSVTDSVDGNLASGDKDAVTVHGFGAVGEAVRVFSLDCRYRPPPVLDVLKYGLYAAGDIKANGGSVMGAPLGTPVLSVTGSLTANIRVGSLTNSGVVIGEVRTSQLPLTTFSDGSLWSLPSRAVLIGYPMIPGGVISKTVLSEGVNPYGSVSTAGLYAIRVPMLSTLTIDTSRIHATLLIEMSMTSRLVVSGANNWSPSDPTLPTLVVFSALSSPVRIGGSAGTLSEAVAGVNFNPMSTPYEGVGDADTADVYPSEIRGVIHVVGNSASIQVDTSAKIIGALICEGAVTLDGNASVVYDPQLLQDPPLPYRTGAAGMDPIPGTWKWQVLP